jgi:hypothetical protein
LSNRSRYHNSLQGKNNISIQTFFSFLTPNLRRISKFENLLIASIRLTNTSFICQTQH